MSQPRIADDAQLPEGVWSQVRALVKAGRDSLDISLATGISQARAERYRRELSFKPQGVKKSQPKRTTR